MDTVAFFFISSRPRRDHYLGLCAGRMPLFPQTAWESLSRLVNSTLLSGHTKKWYSIQLQGAHSELFLVLVGSKRLRRGHTLPIFEKNMWGEFFPFISHPVLIEFRARFLSRRRKFWSQCDHWFFFSSGALEATAFCLLGVYKKDENCPPVMQEKFFAQFSSVSLQVAGTVTRSFDLYFSSHTTLNFWYQMIFFLEWEKETHWYAVPVVHETTFLFSSYDYFLSTTWILYTWNEFGVFFFCVDTR